MKNLTKKIGISLLAGALALAGCTKYEPVNKKKDISKEIFYSNPLERKIATKNRLIYISGIGMEIATSYAEELGRKDYCTCDVIAEMDRNGDGVVSGMELEYYVEAYPALKESEITKKYAFSNPHRLK